MPSLLLQNSEIDLEQFGIVDFGYVDTPGTETFNHFKEWIDSGNHGNLDYLLDERGDLRKGPELVFPEFQSALVFLFSYAKTKVGTINRVAGFVRGFEDKDYHIVVKNHLNSICSEILKESPDIKFMPIVDTHPVLERDLAYRAGLGWFGKNSMLISKKHGSYTIIGSILLDKKLDLPLKKLVDNSCGECRACIDSCPTQAIRDNLTIDASKCISTFTIEQFKKCTPPEGYIGTESIFGCDLCQDSCPWNKKVLKSIKKNEDRPVHKGVEMIETENLASLVKEFESISNREFRRRFKGTSFERTGRIGLLKNIGPSLCDA